MNESAYHDRYPGARPFMDTAIDHRLFFGRNREINELFYQVLGTRLLILFGKSGLGKTSLLQAGVFRRLREQDLLPLPIRLNRTDLPLLELFTTAITETCTQSRIDYTSGEMGSLWEFFKTAVFWRGDSLQTPVLVLDQFEEIFTLQSADNRQWLARQLGELAGDGLPQSLRVRLQPGEKLPYSEKPPTAKIVLSLREDYLGALQELSGEIPRILENRFRLTTMGREQARLAVVEPARLVQKGAFAAQPFDYEEAAVEELLTFLSGRTGEIEPFQLQILCHQVEQQVVATQAKGQQDLHVDKEYLGGRTQMEAILQNFYLDAVRRLPSRQRRNRARELCEVGLLDLQGHRRILEEGDILERYKVDKASLQALVDARLLRKEERQEVFYYELSHDSLVQPVLNSRRWRMPRQLKIGLWISAGLIAALVSTIMGLAMLFATRDWTVPQGTSWVLAKLHFYYVPEMVEIRPGEFLMGSRDDDPKERSDEKPLHPVKIEKRFAMNKYEVTFREYDQFALDTGRNPPSDGNWGRGQQPVINVSWEDAIAYAAWLSEKTGEHYRLPTEAEWEYACRAEKETTYCFEDNKEQLGDYAWYNGNSERRTHLVGRKKANPWGLHDMSGNVWEWVQDCWHDNYHDNYKDAPKDGSAWEEEDCEKRVLRGGSWTNEPERLRGAARDWISPHDVRSSDRGFRLAKTFP